MIAAGIGRTRGSVAEAAIRDARRRQRKRRLAFVAAGLVLVGLVLATWPFRGGGSGPAASWTAFHGDGVSVRLPSTWYATARPLTFVTSPQQILAVASYPLPTSNAGADGCEPAEALARMPADGAFIYGWTYGDANAVRLGSNWPFPPQPRHFTLRNFGHYECMGRSYMLTFSAGGRAFQVHVAFGREATADTRSTALRILDSFRAGH